MPRIPPPWSPQVRGLAANLAKRRRLARKFHSVNMTKDELRTMAAQAAASTAIAKIPPR